MSLDPGVAVGTAPTALHVAWRSPVCPGSRVERLGLSLPRPGLVFAAALIRALVTGFIDAALIGTCVLGHIDLLLDLPLPLMLGLATRILVLISGLSTLRAGGPAAPLFGILDGITALMLWLVLLHIGAAAGDWVVLGVSLLSHDDLPSQRPERTGLEVVPVNVRASVLSVLATRRPPTIRSQCRCNNQRLSSRAKIMLAEQEMTSATERNKALVRAHYDATVNRF